MKPHLMSRLAKPGWINVMSRHVPLMLLALGMGGCATTQEDILPQDGKPMQQIYEEHFQRTRGVDVAGARGALVNQKAAGRTRTLSPGAADLDGYTRNAFNEIDTLFPRLPNPTLVMFVYPHLAGPEGVPIPGYTTTFPMYEHVEYALPGEVPNLVEP